MSNAEVIFRINDSFPMSTHENQATNVPCQVQSTNKMAYLDAKILISWIKNPPQGNQVEDLQILLSSSQMKREVKRFDVEDYFASFDDEVCQTQTFLKVYLHVGRFFSSRKKASSQVLKSVLNIALSSKNCNTVRDVLALVRRYMPEDEITLSLLRDGMIDAVAAGEEKLLVELFSFIEAQRENVDQQWMEDMMVGVLQQNKKECLIVLLPFLRRQMKCPNLSIGHLGAPLRLCIILRQMQHFRVLFQFILQNFYKGGDLSKGFENLVKGLLHRNYSEEEEAYAKEVFLFIQEKSLEKKIQKKTLEDSLMNAISIDNTIALKLVLMVIKNGNRAEEISSGLPLHIAVNLAVTNNRWQCLEMLFQAGLILQKHTLDDYILVAQGSSHAETVEILQKQKSLELAIND